jgi:hypothetical protein
MHEAKIVAVGVGLLIVGLAPPRWQERRFVRFNRQSRLLASRRPVPVSLASRVIMVACCGIGLGFIAWGIALAVR